MSEAAYELEVARLDAATVKGIQAVDFEVDGNNNLVIELPDDGGVVYAAGNWTGFTIKKVKSENA